MKRFFKYFYVFFAVFCSFNFFEPKLVSNVKASTTTKTTPKMAIVIDDFGSYDEHGIDTLLKANIPLTCAVLPNTDNTTSHLNKLANKPYEIILHMPMEAYVNLPQDWYGPVYVTNNDTDESIKKKLDECLSQFPNVKGFNIHIGSGVSKNKKIMTSIYNYANAHNLYFLDSRTIETKATEIACKDTNSVYLGRDVFLEANKNRSYNGVKYRLNEGLDIAKEKGYCIVIGHVGAEGGENTAKAIVDMLPEIEKSGVKIVPLSEIYQDLKQTHKVK